MPPPVTSLDPIPDPQQWNRVTIGMSEQQVVDLIGEPLQRDPSQPPNGTDPSIWGYAWDYGDFQYSSDAFPFPFRFELVLSQGKVIGIVDPFNRAVSDHGLPTTPELLIPEDEGVFKHFPRFVDLRWHPSAGKSPVAYDVSVELFNGHGPYIADPFQKQTSQIPYMAIVFGGAQKGRWRVRARNSLGTSKWSEFRYFRFTR